MNNQSKEVTLSSRSQELSLSPNEKLDLGKVLAESGMFSEVKTKAQAIAKILAGRELGLAPIVSMTKIYMVKGKMSLSSELMGGIVKKSGTYDYSIRKLDESRCELEFFRIESGKRILVGESIFTMSDAQKAGVAHGDNYKKYPRNMLLARALSNGVRFHCPHLVAGAYIPEELGAEVNGKTGEMKVAEIPVEEKPISGCPPIEKFNEELPIQEVEEVKAAEVIPEEEKPESDSTEKISTDQRKRLYTICTHANWTHDQAKVLLKKEGFDSATDITLKSYDRICKEIEEHPKKETKSQAKKEENKIDPLTIEILAEAERVSDKVYQELLKDLNFTEKDLDDKEKAETVLRLLKKI